MNLPKFEERDKVAVVKEIEKVVQAGGKIEDLYAINTLSSEEVSAQEPKQLIINHNEILKNEVEIKQLTDQEVSMDLTKQFNAEFNKNYDVKFMENLIKKYGREQVAFILSEMKRINAEGTERINNPAGYITQSLKNNQINSEKSSIGN